MFSGIASGSLFRQLALCAALAWSITPSEATCEIEDCFSPYDEPQLPFDPPSTFAGRQLAVEDVVKIAYDAGFREEEQLLAAVAMAMAESSLWSAARNWKPERGYRPESDEITVMGPPEAWLDRRQMHSDRGLWQISSWSWSHFGDVVTDDPRASAVVVFYISSGGTDFSAWDSFKSGDAISHFDAPFRGWPALRPIVQAFLASRGQLQPPA